jgi:hypothetical protein
MSGEPKRNKDGSVDCPTHGRTGCLVFHREGDPPDVKKPVCVKCLAATMVNPIRCGGLDYSRAPLT